MGFSLPFKTRQSKAAGRPGHRAHAAAAVNAVERKTNIYKRLLGPLTASRLNKFINRFKPKHAREKKPSLDTRSVVTDWPAFFAGGNPPTDEAAVEPEQSISRARPRSLTLSEALADWVIYDRHINARSSQASGAPVDPGPVLVDASSSDSWITTNGSSVANPGSPESPCEIPCSPWLIRHLRRVNGFGKLRASVTLQSFTEPRANGLRDNKEPHANQSGNNSRANAARDDIYISPDRYTWTNLEPSWIRGLDDYDNARMNSNPVLSEHSDSMDIELLAEIYGPISTPSDSQMVNERFFLRIESAPASPVLRPMSPVDHFYSPAVVDGSPGRLISFALPPPLRELPLALRAGVAPPRPPRPPAHLCPPPIPLSPYENAPPHVKAAAEEAILRANIKALWGSNPSLEQQEAAWRAVSRTNTDGV